MGRRKAGVGGREWGKGLVCASFCFWVIGRKGKLFGRWRLGWMVELLVRLGSKLLGFVGSGWKRYEVVCERREKKK